MMPSAEMTQMEIQTGEMTQWLSSDRDEDADCTDNAFVAFWGVKLMMTSIEVTQVTLSLMKMLTAEMTH